METSANTTPSANADVLSGAILSPTSGHPSETRLVLSQALEGPSRKRLWVRGKLVHHSNPTTLWCRLRASNNFVNRASHPAQPFVTDLTDRQYPALGRELIVRAPPLFAGEPSENSQRSLRAIVTKTTESIAVVPIVAQTLTRQELELIDLASSLGYVVQLRDGLIVNLSQGIASRLRPRTGSNVYQMPAFSVPSFPRRLAEELFSGGPVMKDTPSCITWRWEAEEEWHHMHAMFSNLMATQGAACAGQSKGLQTESEFCVRVIATIITPVEISWVAMSRGVDMLYLNFAYTLIDHNGELHPPKDSTRREIELTDTLQTLIRQQALSDAMLMADQGAPMSPSFLRHMGRQQEAMIAAARLQQQESTVPLPQKGKRRAIKAPEYEVAEVLDEKGTGANHSYLVRWAGYHPSWEAWRMADWEGQPGDPVDSWERVTQNLLQTEAARRWKEEKRRRRIA